MMVCQLAVQAVNQRRWRMVSEVAILEYAYHMCRRCIVLQNISHLNLMSLLDTIHLFFFFYIHTAVIAYATNIEHLENLSEAVERICEKHCARK